MFRRLSPRPNGRDWHHLLELCGLVDARVIDLDGVYNPCRPNDRLLLGMKGSISEFELGVLRARMLDGVTTRVVRSCTESVNEAETANWRRQDRSRRRRGEQSLPRLLQRAVGVQVMIERA